MDREYKYMEKYVLNKLYTTQILYRVDGGVCAVGGRAASVAAAGRPLARETGSSAAIELAIIIIIIRSFSPLVHHPSSQHNHQSSLWYRTDFERVSVCQRRIEWEIWKHLPNDGFSTGKTDVNHPVRKKDYIYYYTTYGVNDTKNRSFH